MKRQIVIVTCLIALVFPLVLTGCCRVEMTRLQEELDQTRSERDELSAKLVTAMQDRGKAQAQPVQHVQTIGLSGTFSEFQKQIDAFISFREELQRREDELAKLRQAALAEAETAQERMDQLGTKLQAETERVLALQDQLKLAQGAIVDLKDKLKE